MCRVTLLKHALRDLHAILFHYSSEPDGMHLFRAHTNSSAPRLCNLVLPQRTGEIYSSFRARTRPTPATPNRNHLAAFPNSGDILAESSLQQLHLGNTKFYSVATSKYIKSTNSERHFDFQLPATIRLLLDGNRQPARPLSPSIPGFEN